ncbi:hypothetical protein ACQYRI_09270 [Salmonella enterica]
MRRLLRLVICDSDTHFHHGIVRFFSYRPDHPGKFHLIADHRSRT